MPRPRRPSRPATDGCRLNGTFQVWVVASVNMNLKRLREYLPLVGAAYSKLRNLREAHRELDRQLNETARQRNDLARERDDLARQCQAPARQNDAYRAHLQISPGGPPFLEGQCESTRLRFIELLRLIRPFDIA